MTEPIDILSDSYIEQANEELRTKPCPNCDKVGSAQVSKQFFPSLTLNYSLAAAQTKVPGSFHLIFDCNHCGVKARLSQ